MLTARPGSPPTPLLTALLAGMLAFMLGGCSPKITQESIKDIPLAQVRKHMESQATGKNKDVILMIDARGPKAFAAGHIPDARNLSLGDFPDRNDRRELDRRIERFGYKVVYGEDRGSSAAQALVKRMLGLGYGGVYMYMGGMEEWRRENMPVVVDEPEPPK